MESIDRPEGRQHHAAGPPARHGSASEETTGRVAGVVLAAGAGTRMGRPKALVADERGPWLARAASLLLGAGCDPVLVVLGASAHDAAHLLPRDARLVPVVADGWTEGVGASLRAALDAAAALPLQPGALLVTLVDLPWLRPEAAARVMAGGADPGTLRRAVYDGVPGHPVLIGRDHWAALNEGLAGDRGAGPYLAAHGAVPVDCTGLGGDRDVDTA